jgi:hypothetical protein
LYGYEHGLLGGYHAMTSTRQILVGTFLFTSIVFLWASLYIPAHNFHWTIPLGDGVYGLCRVKSWLYIAVGEDSPFQGIQIPLHIASALIAAALGLLLLAFLFVWRYFELKTITANLSDKRLNEKPTTIASPHP